MSQYEQDMTKPIPSPNKKPSIYKIYIYIYIYTLHAVGGSVLRRRGLVQGSVALPLNDALNPPESLNP